MKLRAVFLFALVLSFDVFAQGPEYLQIGDSLLRLDQRDSAIKVYQMGIEAYSIAGRDMEKAVLLDVMGKLYRTEMSYDTAYDRFSKALKVRRKAGSPQVALSYLYLGTVRGKQELDQLAIKEFNKARNFAENYLRENYEINFSLQDKNRLEKLRQLSDTSEVSSLLKWLSYAQNNLGLQYLNILEKGSGTIEKDLTNTEVMALKDSAIYFLSSALLLKTVLGVPSENLANTYNNMGKVFQITEQTDSALLLHQKAAKLRSEAADNEGLASSYQNIGLCYYKQKRIDSATYFFYKSKALALAYSLNDVKWHLYRNLMELHLDACQIDSVRFYLNKLDRLDRKVFNESNSRQINQIQEKLNVEEKNKTIKNQQKTINLTSQQRNLLGLVLVFTLFLSLLIWYFLHQRTKSIRKIAEQRDQIASQQINQLLSEQELKSINSMLEGQETERQRIAQDLHDKLGSTLVAARMNFEAIRDHGDMSTVQPYQTAQDLLDRAIEDARNIAYNLLSGVLTKFGLIAALEDLKNTVEGTGNIEMKLLTNNLDERLSGEVELNLYRIIQEFVSNVLKHAKATNITVQLNRHNGDLTLTVEDNGLGFDSKKTGVEKGGMGLKNVESRTMKINGTFQIDSTPGRGTIMIINVKLT